MTATIIIRSDSSGVDLSQVTQQFVKLGQSQEQAVKSAQAVKKEWDSRQLKENAELVKKMVDEYDGTAEAARKAAREVEALRRIQQQSADESLKRQRTAANFEFNRANSGGVSSAKLKAIAEAKEKKRLGSVDSAKERQRQMRIQAIRANAGSKKGGGGGSGAHRVGMFGTAARAINSTAITYGHENQLRMLGGLADKIGLSLAAGLGTGAAAAGALVVAFTEMDKRGSGLTRTIRDELGQGVKYVGKGIDEWFGGMTRTVDSAAKYLNIIGLTGTEQTRLNQLVQEHNRLATEGARDAEVNRKFTRQRYGVEQGFYGSEAGRRSENQTAREMEILNSDATAEQADRRASQERRNLNTVQSSYFDRIAKQGLQNQATAANLGDTQSEIQGLEQAKAAEKSRDKQLEIQHRINAARERERKLQEELSDGENALEQDKAGVEFMQKKVNVAEEKARQIREKEQAEVRARNADRKRQLDAAESSGISGAVDATQNRFAEEDRLRKEGYNHNSNFEQYAEFKKTQDLQKQTQDANAQRELEIGVAQKDRQRSDAEYMRTNWERQSQFYRSQKQQLEDSIRDSEHRNQVVTEGDRKRVEEFSQLEKESRQREEDSEREARQRTEETYRKKRQFLIDNGKKQEEIADLDHRRTLERLKEEDDARRKNLDRQIQDEERARQITLSNAQDQAQKQQQAQQQAQQQVMQPDANGMTPFQKALGQMPSKKLQQKTLDEIARDRAAKKFTNDELLSKDKDDIRRKNKAFQDERRKVSQQMKAQGRGKRFMDPDKVREARKSRDQGRDWRKSQLQRGDLSEGEKRKIRKDGANEDKDFRQKMKRGDFDSKIEPGEVDNAQAEVTKGLTEDAKKKGQIGEQQATQFSQMIDSVGQLAGESARLQQAVEQNQKGLNQLQDYLQKRFGP